MNPLILLLNDPNVWYEVNAHASKRLLISGLIPICAAIVLYFIPRLTIDGYSLSMLVFALGRLMVGLSQGFRFLDHLAPRQK
jgi:hypothetical protein